MTDRDALMLIGLFLIGLAALGWLFERLDPWRLE